MCAGSSQKLRFTKAQLRVLEETFERLQRPNAHQKSTLALELGVQPRQVEVWFQNRRARGKAKRNESDCEVLRQQCQDLIVENHHLNYLIQVITIHSFPTYNTLKVCLFAGGSDRKRIRKGEKVEKLIPPLTPNLLLLFACTRGIV